MKITDVELLQYRWERGTPIRNGMHTYTHSGLNLLRIHTDAGLTGLGWAHKPQTPAWRWCRRACWSTSSRC